MPCEHWRCCQNIKQKREISTRQRIYIMLIDKTKWRKCYKYFVNKKSKNCLSLIPLNCLLYYTAASNTVYSVFFFQEHLLLCTLFSYHQISLCTFYVLFLVNLSTQAKIYHAKLIQYPPHTVHTNHLIYVFPLST